MTNHSTLWLPGLHRAGPSTPLDECSLGYEIVGRIVSHVFSFVKQELNSKYIQEYARDLRENPCALSMHQVWGEGVRRGLVKGNWSGRDFLRR
jgi:hypothetical protein